MWEDELTYLGTYAEAPDACVIMTYEGLAVIRAVIRSPQPDSRSRNYGVVINSIQFSEQPLLGSQHGLERSHPSL